MRQALGKGKGESEGWKETVLLSVLSKILTYIYPQSETYSITLTFSDKCAYQRKSSMVSIGYPASRTSTATSNGSSILNTNLRSRTSFDVRQGLLELRRRSSSYGHMRCLWSTLVVRRASGENGSTVSKM